MDDRLHSRRRGFVGCLHRAGAIAMGYWERLQKTDDKERRAQRGLHPAIWGAVFLVGIFTAWIWKLLVGYHPERRANDGNGRLLALVESPEPARTEVGTSLYKQLFRQISARAGNISPIGAIDARLAFGQAYVAR